MHGEVIRERERDLEIGIERARQGDTERKEETREQERKGEIQTENKMVVISLANEDVIKFGGD